MIKQNFMERQFVRCKRMVNESAYAPNEVVQFVSRWHENMSALCRLGEALPDLFEARQMPTIKENEQVELDCVNLVVARFMQEMSVAYKQITLRDARYMPAIEPSEDIVDLMQELRVSQHFFRERLKIVLASVFYHGFGERPEGAAFLARQEEKLAEVADHLWLWIVDSLQNTPQI